jgi:hypothetical protein
LTWQQGNGTASHPMNNATNSQTVQPSHNDTNGNSHQTNGNGNGHRNGNSHPIIVDQGG